MNIQLVFQLGVDHWYADWPPIRHESYMTCQAFSVDSVHLSFVICAAGWNPAGRVCVNRQLVENFS